MTLVDEPFEPPVRGRRDDGVARVADPLRERRKLWFHVAKATAELVQVQA